MTETLASPPDTSMVAQIAAMQDYDLYRDLAWEGSFEEYLAIVRERPQVTRNAFQRMYDMVISYGTEEYIDNKKKLIRYNFFHDEIDEGKDAIFGLDIPLMRLVHVLKAASEGYGPEKRVILLHGPVGSCKSTIARLLKKGIERYSRTPDGALFTFDWVEPGRHGPGRQRSRPFDSPMHEEPLRLIPQEWREKAIGKLGLSNDKFRVKVEGDLDPASRFIFNGLMLKYEGDWGKVVHNHIRVQRLVLSEKDRIGIGTFQPKDEKNQDSTELTGDINYRKIAEYGSDSDPRAFNFDGEFNIANRGIVEFVEMLKLDVAFLYDLLGASQEHKIKPKKFAQTDIDEVIIGHTNEAEYKHLLNNEFMEALARPHDQDRHPVHHEAVGRDSHLREGLQSRARARQAHRAAHAGGRRDVGGACAARGAEEAQPAPPPEDEAVRRQGAARLHAGHRERAAQGDEARGHGRHQPALRAGQDLERARQRRGRGHHQPVHGLERAREGPVAPLAHHQRRRQEALPRSDRRREARVRRDRQERSPARDQRRRRSDRASSPPTTSTTSRPTR